MFFKLLLLFTTIPLVEIWLLLEISKRLGVLDTIALVIITGFTGAWLARSQGLQIFRTIQFELQQGKMPSDSLIEGLLLLIAGIVLITPGLITDCAGILLLIPPTRKYIMKYLKNRFQKHYNIQNIYYYDDTN